MGRHDVKQEPPPTNEEHSATISTLAGLADLEPQQRIRVLRTAAAYYKIPATFAKERPQRLRRLPKTNLRRLLDGEPVADPMPSIQETIDANPDLKKIQDQINSLSNKARREDAALRAIAEGEGLDGNEREGTSGLMGADHMRRGWDKAATLPCDKCGKRSGSLASTWTKALGSCLLCPECVPVVAHSPALDDRVLDTRTLINPTEEELRLRACQQSLECLRNDGHDGECELPGTVVLPPPEAMLGAADGFGGSDYPDPPRPEFRDV